MHRVLIDRIAADFGSRERFVVPIEDGLLDKGMIRHLHIARDGDVYVNIDGTGFAPGTLAPGSLAGSYYIARLRLPEPAGGVAP
jgi:hypothetical protein